MFKPLEGETVVLKKCSKASVSYTQNDLAVYNGFVFARTGASYIMLCENARTSAVNQTWESLSITKLVEYGKHGKMLLTGH